MSNKNLIAAHKAATNQERRYLRALMSNARDAMYAARINADDPVKAKMFVVMAEDNLNKAFNRLTDEIVEYEISLDRSSR